MPRGTAMFRVSTLALCLTLMGLGQAQAGIFDDDVARQQIADLTAQLEARSDQQAKAQLELANQILRQADEIAALRGQIESLMYELETGKKRQQDFYVDLDTRIRRLEMQPTPAPSATGEAPAAPVNDAAQEGQEYEAALNLFKANRFKDAAAAFAAFVQKFGSSNLAPNAQYWLGNAWYAQHDCKRAIEAQTVVLSRWPDATKAPDALLAIANCQQEQGGAAAARKTLEGLLAKYPGTLAATTAKERLGKK